MTDSQNLSTKRYKYIAFLLATALLWSFGGLLIKSITWGPLAICGGRSIIAAMVFIPIIKNKKRSFNPAFIGGVLCYIGTVVLYVSATKYTTAANAILLQYTAPIYVALFSWWLLKEKILKADWITIIVVILGMILFFIDSMTTKGMFGNILACLSGVCFGMQTIFLRLQKNDSPERSIFWGNVLTFLILSPFIFKDIQANSNPSNYIYIIILGVFQLGISYIIYSIAIKHVSAIEGVLVPVLEPIMNPVWVFLFIGERPTISAILGGIVVICAVTVNSVYRTKMLIKNI
jgi:drug/metabolite transporter (DMT)-like permease